MAGLIETARRNEVAKDLLGLVEQGKAADSQKAAVENNLRNLLKAVVAEDVFTVEDEAEVQAVLDEVTVSE